MVARGQAMDGDKFFGTRKRRPARRSARRWHWELETIIAILVVTWLLGMIQLVHTIG
ncbi:hypothetical protein [Novosphingobium malaysiense]|uniref:hypothetical protein n=1 Tax=Novosphingobium malaysiense TaxID=1348853 RepID=UPI0012E075DE|nr:hypothetical protein [Novosphingobium malaysiense]